jgi:hypothetical protein
MSIRRNLLTTCIFQGAVGVSDQFSKFPDGVQAEGALWVDICAQEIVSRDPLGPSKPNTSPASTVMLKFSNSQTSPGNVFPRLHPVTAGISSSRYE